MKMKEYTAIADGFGCTLREKQSGGLYKAADVDAKLEKLQRERDKAVKSLKAQGFTDCGGEQWKPPIGEKPTFPEDVAELQAKAVEDASLTYQEAENAIGLFRIECVGKSQEKLWQDCVNKVLSLRNQAGEEG